MDYTTLVAGKTTNGSIAAWVNYARIDSITVLAEAQAEIYARLRVREMRTLDTSITTVSGTAAYSLPSLFLDPIDPLIDNQGNVYVHKTEGELLSYRNFDSAGALVTGIPALWSIFDEKLQFDVSFNTTGWIFQLMCFKSLPLLSGGNTTNFLTNRYPHLLRRACMMQAADFMDDDTSYQKQLVKFEALCEAINSENDLHYRGVHADGMTSNWTY
jgi:hypothetical protein